MNPSPMTVSLEGERNLDTELQRGIMTCERIEAEIGGLLPQMKEC